MLLKNKRYIFLFLSFIFTIAISCLALKNYANALSINPETDVNCSKYLNILYNDSFNKNITVSTLNVNKVYNVGDSYSGDYKTSAVVASDSMIKKNIGFTCNGVFYSDYINLDKSGNYVFKVFGYTINEENIIIPMASCLETINLTVDLDGGLQMSNNNFYYEHYGDSAYLQQAILNSFNYKVSFSALTSENITRAYKKYLTEYENDKGDISEKVDVEGMNIEVYYNGTPYNFAINLKSTTNKGLRENFVTSIEEMTQPIDYRLAFDLNKFPAMQNKIAEEYLASSLDINEKLAVSEGQNVKAEFTSQTTIPSIANSNKVYFNKTITYDVYDYTLNSECGTFYQQVAFYNSNLKHDYIVNVVTNEDYVCLKNSEFNLDEFVSEVYGEIKFDNITYRDYYSIKNVDVINKVNTSVVGETVIDINVEFMNGDTFLVNKTVEIVDNKPPIVLTEYNYIIVEKDSPSYLNQIKIIDNDQVVESKTEYTLVETGKSGGYILVVAYDNQGLKTEVSLPFIYKTELNFYQKTFGKFLYEYGKFLKKLF